MKNETIFGISVLLFLAVLFVGAMISCGDESKSSGTGSGYTEDVGNACIGLCKHDDWCTDVNLPDCVSFHCVGRSSDSMYCSQLCLSPDECPDGYTCTIDCNLDASGEPYCVKNTDYEYLQDIGLCS